MAKDEINEYIHLESGTYSVSPFPVLVDVVTLHCPSADASTFANAEFAVGVVQLALGNPEPKHNDVRLRAFP